MIVVLAGLALAAGAEVVLVEDWSQPLLGARGIPTGWRPYETIGGRPAYDFTVVENDGRRALQLHVDLRATPILEWSWKAVQLPARGDIRRKETSDLTAHIFVIWPRFPAMLRSRLIGYVWDATAPVQTVETSHKTGSVHFFVLRSGPGELGRWLTERRNVLEDYRRVFGEDPEDPRALALSIDTNDTHSEAEALIGRIAFLSAGAPR